MKTRFLVLTSAAALAAGAFAFAGTEPDKNSAATGLDRLQKKISALESRVKGLEQQLQTSAPLNYTPRLQPQIPLQPESDSGWLPPQEIYHPFVPSLEENTERPKIWGEGQINGWKYYLIPCVNRSAVSLEADPLKVIPPK